jgi:hypothetical protein
MFGHSRSKRSDGPIEKIRTDSICPRPRAGGTTRRPLVPSYHHHTNAPTDRPHEAFPSSSFLHLLLPPSYLSRCAPRVKHDEDCFLPCDRPPPPSSRNSGTRQRRGGGRSASRAGSSDDGAAELRRWGLVVHHGGVRGLAVRAGAAGQPHAPGGLGERLRRGGRRRAPGRHSFRKHAVHGGRVQRRRHRLHHQQQPDGVDPPRWYVRAAVGSTAPERAGFVASSNADLLTHPSRALFPY